MLLVQAHDVVHIDQLVAWLQPAAHSGVAVVFGVEDDLAVRLHK